MKREQETLFKSFLVKTKSLKIEFKTNRQKTQNTERRKDGIICMFLSRHVRVSE